MEFDHGRIGEFNEYFEYQLTKRRSMIAQKTGFQGWYIYFQSGKSVTTIAHCDTSENAVFALEVACKTWIRAVNP